MSSENVVKGGDIDEQKFVGGKKKNGHKMDCMCPICKNMAAKAKRHGYTDDELKKQERKKGKHKENGHRSKCPCQICENMSKHKKGTKKRKSRKSKKSKKNRSRKTRK